MTTYRHFQIEQLADGVYAALASPTGGAACNAGIVALGDRALVFDTCATVTAGRELRAAAEALTGLPVTWVVNSHWHPDHVHGNIAFAGDAVIISSIKTRSVMAAEGLERMERFRQQILSMVSNAEAALGQAASETQRAELQEQLETGRSFLEGYPAPSDYRLPTLAIADEAAFCGAGRTARMIVCGTGHTVCDSVLWLPEEGILFSADLVTEGDLVLRYGDAEQWLTALDRLEALQPRLIVTGHGGVLPGEVGISHARGYLERALAAGQ